MNLELAKAFIGALTGNPDSICDFRVINDRVKGDEGRNLRGTLDQLAESLTQYNQQGWGVFMCVNEMDGQGHKLPNVAGIRTHFADCDNPLSSADAYNRAVNSSMPPHFAVQTSPGKFHLYWLMEKYAGNDFFSFIQRKLVQLYDSDKQTIDATRVLRVPGFYHCKGDPILVNCWGIHNQPRYTHEQINQYLASINVIEHISSRKELGDPKLAAPSLEYLIFALKMFDPNDLSRDEWMPLTAAFKQAGWSLATEDTLLKIWLEWCAQYVSEDGDDLAVNMKLWNSIRDSEVGWGRFERLSHVKAYMMHYPEKPPEINANGQVVKDASVPMPVILPKPKEQSVDPRDNLGEVIDSYGKQIWFRDCYFIARTGHIFSPEGRFMNATQFNGLYGGKEFTLKHAGNKMTDEPWKAALRSTDWTIPKVDHVRFRPDVEPHSIILDELNRKGLNTYIPANIPTAQGDISRWFDFLRRIFNTPDDIKIFNDYVGHCIRFPGHKIPWAILLQSGEGIGKQMIGSVIKFCIGESYTYEPDADELISGASNFNGWMRNKIMVLVDEIRVGDRRDLLEGLKKIITDRRIAIESKGVDQEMEDNVANWIFFSNYRDAIPITENQRRYCVFYSKLQNARAIEQAGMDKNFFDTMYNWLQKEKGYEALAYYYLNYPIEAGGLPHRAPKTSSYDEVIRIGRSPLEILIDDKVSNGERGFIGGFISLPILYRAIADSSMRYKPPEHAIQSLLESRGYVELGKTDRPIPGEDMARPSVIYGKANLSVRDYEAVQATASN